MKLAIVIEGEQNSGKTSTIKELVKIYGRKSISRIRAGRQRLYLNSIFQPLKLDVYCVPASPSETRKPLKTRFATGRFPDVLIVAVQPNGDDYSNSYAFLKAHNFTILTYTIINDFKDGSDWNRFDSDSKSSKLKNRADEIIKDIRQFIKKNNLI